MKQTRQKEVVSNTEEDMKDFTDAVKLSAQYLGFEALSRGCYNIYHVCKLLENITEHDQSYVPYSTDD